jgi:hypothetical protein
MFPQMEPGFWVAKTVATPANKALIVLRYGLTQARALVEISDNQQSTPCRSPAHF